MKLTYMNSSEYLQLLSLPVWPFVRLSRLILVLSGSYSDWISTCPSSSLSHWLCWWLTCPLCAVVSPWQLSPGAHSSLKFNRGHTQIIAFAKGPNFNTEWPALQLQQPVNDRSGNNTRIICSIITTSSCGQIWFGWYVKCANLCCHTYWNSAALSAYGRLI